MYSHVKYVFVFLFIVTVISFIISGFKISKCKSNKQFWRLAIWPILTYSIFLGLRFGRLIDYNLYYFRYKDIGKGVSTDDYEILFKLICKTLYELGFSYPVFIFLCSLFLIIVSLNYIKKYKEAAPFLLIVLLVVTAPVEQLIRWYLAVSFFIIAISNLNNKNYKLYILFSILASMVHIGLAPITVFVLAFSFIKKYLFNTNIALLLLFVTTFLATVQNLLVFNKIISFLSFNDRTTVYVNNFENMISGDFGISRADQITLFQQIRVFLAYSFPIYQIPKLLKHNKISILQANLSVITFIAIPIFSQLEILSRYTYTLMLFSLIIIGYSYNDIYRNYKKTNWKLICFSILSILSLFYPYLQAMLMRKDWFTMLFIWDANGRNFLNVNYFAN